MLILQSIRNSLLGSATEKWNTNANVKNDLSIFLYFISQWLFLKLNFELIEE